MRSTGPGGRRWLPGKAVGLFQHKGPGEGPGVGWRHILLEVEASMNPGRIDGSGRHGTREGT